MGKLVRELQRERIKIACDRLSTGKRVMIRSLEQDWKERRGLNAATGKKGWAEFLEFGQLQPRKESRMFQRWHCISESLSDLLRFPFLTLSSASKEGHWTLFSVWRRSRVLQFLPMLHLQDHSHEVVRFCMQLPCLTLGEKKKESPNNKHTKNPPKLMKTGKEKQAPTSNLPSLCLPPASLPTSLAMGVLGEQRQGRCALVRAFSRGTGWEIGGCWLSRDTCSSEGQLPQTVLLCSVWPLRWVRSKMVMESMLWDQVPVQHGRGKDQLSREPSQ